MSSDNRSVQKICLLFLSIFCLASCFRSIPHSISTPQVEPYKQPDGIEGGELIKALNGYLIILRKGIIYSAKKIKKDIKTVSSIKTDNYGLAPSFPRRRLFILRERVVVVSWSAPLSAIGVGLFKLDHGGKLIHLSTKYLSGCQFYTNGKSIVSRIIDDKLIFYVPTHIRGYTDKNNPTCQAKLSASDPAPRPSMIGHWQKGSIIKWKNIVELGNYNKKLAGSDSIHTIYYCNLLKDNLSCSSKSVRGGFARDFYVSSSAAYLWTLGSDCLKKHQTYGATVYRFPISSSSKEDVTIWKTFGTPVNKFSTREINGKLYSVVQKVSCSLTLEKTIHTNTGNGKIYLVDKPIRDFATKNKASVSYDSKSYSLPSLTGVVFYRNRFVGSKYVYGYHKQYQDSNKTINIVDIDTKKVKLLLLNHTVDSIARIDNNSFIVQGKSYDTIPGHYNYSLVDSPIQISSVSIENNPVVRSRYVYKPATNSETHTVCSSIRQIDKIKGFTNKIISLPMQQTSGEFSHLKYGTAKILFMSIDAQLQISEIGVIQAHEQK
ncbi:MAG: beta-propeller domain-containing protein, partial [Bacteroidota bacterium]